MAQISDVSFNSSSPSSATRSKEQTPSAPDPSARETEKVQNKDQRQGQSTASVERAAQQEERADATRDAEVRNDSVRAEKQRDQIVEDTIESKEQASNSSSAPGGLDEANPGGDNPEDVGASPSQASRTESRQDARSDANEEEVSQEAPGARADEVRNERANEVAQDSLRDFETREQKGTGSGSTAEIKEVVARQEEAVRPSDEPSFEPPEQRVNEAGTAGRQQSDGAVSKTTKKQVSQEPERPVDAQTERGLNIDQLI